MGQSCGGCDQGANVRRTGRIRLLGVVLLVAACSGTSSPGPVPLTRHTSRPPSAALTAAVAPTVVSDYSRRNNAVLAQLVTTYSDHAWDTVDTGSLLAEDRFDSAVTWAVQGHGQPLDLTFTADETWANGFVAFPIWAIVRVTATSVPPPESGVPDDYLLVIRRDSNTSPWKNEMTAPVEAVPHRSDDRPGTTTADDVSRARSTRLAIVRYLETGDLPDVYVTPYLSGTRTQFSEPQPGERARSASCRPYPLEPPDRALPETLRVVRSASGVLDMMVILCTETRTSSPGHTLTRLPGFARALGVPDGPAAVLTQDFAVTVAVSRPTRGRAIVVGTDVHPVRPPG